MSKNNLILIGSIFLLFLLWSSSYTAVFIALKEFSPEGLALFRFLISSIVLFLLSLRFKVRMPDKKDLPLILTCGALGVCVGSIILFHGQKSTPVAVASILINTYPIFVAIFSFLIFKELFNVVKLAGIVICFIGIFIVSGGTMTHFAIKGSMFLIILSAIIISLYDLEQKKLMKKYSPFELTCYFVWSGTLFLLLFSKSLLHDLSYVQLSSILSAVYLAVFQSIVAAIVWGKLILKYSVTSLACCCYVTPFFAMGIAFLFLHQMPTASAIYGSIFVISGLLISNFSKYLNFKKVFLCVNRKEEQISAD